VSDSREKQDNAFDSMRVNLEPASNEIDESDWPNEKQSEQRICA
jgi:hypothetical protein